MGKRSIKSYFTKSKIIKIISELIHKLKLNQSINLIHLLPFELQLMHHQEKG